MFKWLPITFMLCLSSCAALTSFDKEKPVDINSSLMNTYFTPNGKTIKADEMINHIDEVMPEKNF